MFLNVITVMLSIGISAEFKWNTEVRGVVKNGSLLIMWNYCISYVSEEIYLTLTLI